ncbi:hypothetical protein J3R30DRAFT_3560131 [Lentinula aciculospora]|uniref:RNA polymerase II elongation factor ELL N-terminal domain-containing protein n=1 Tax=Lentinula aciculospora TaxID=153920 RepID=A0A9W8ZVK9_9AGAR|nr:hypothetical protein J3R30DRAFT_3560131 [Lentinula aciculospora]
MPLPNATYALQGQSRPGDPMYSKPKHGMLLRLSSEAINALQSDAKPNVDFVVSEDGSSRIVIGESSFSLQSQTEEIPHDLYLRSASVAKPFVPLKFYANVIGRLTISERELNDELANRIRKSTAAAAKKRQDPKTKFIDANDLPQPATKAAARKKAELFRKPLRPSDQLKPTAHSASTSSAPSPRPSHTPRSSQDGTTPMEKRLIHYLALAERTNEDAIKAVGGTSCDAKTRQDILDAMHRLAEKRPATKGTQQIWRLKNESWLDVRPYEWPRLSETERTTLARGARQALNSLGIPESDPRWEHAKYRPPSNITRTHSPAPPPPSISTSNSAQGSTSATAPKRGISSKEAKEKKARKPAKKGEIMIKDETKARVHHVPSPSTSASNSVQATAKTAKTPTPPSMTGAGTPPTRLTPTVRRLPGSGYKLPPKTVDLSRSENKSKDGSITSSTSSPSTASKDLDITMKDVARRPIEPNPKGDQRASNSRPNVKKEDGELSASSSGTSGIGVRANDKPAPVKRIKHLRDEVLDSDRESVKGKDKLKNQIRERVEGKSRDSERIQERMNNTDRDRRKEGNREISLERAHNHEHEPLRRNSDVSSLKRKKLKEEDEEPNEGSSRTGWKRRKTENGMEASSMNGSTRDREHDRAKEGERAREREKGRDKGRERERNKDKEHERSKKERDVWPSKSNTESALDRKRSANSQSHSTKGKAIKKEPSPLPLSFNKGKNNLSPVQIDTSTTSNSSTKGAKFRRKSPVYTSSDDEIAPRHPNSALPTPTASSSSTGSHRSHSSTDGALINRNANVNEQGHESDHRNALRSKYTASYVKYLNTFQTLVSQKQEIERLLNRAGSESRSDSDGDVELLDFEGLTKILSQNKQQWEELQSIQLEHEREMFS